MNRILNEYPDAHMKNSMQKIQGQRTFMVFSQGFHDPEWRIKSRAYFERWNRILDENSFQMTRDMISEAVMTATAILGTSPEDPMASLSCQWCPCHSWFRSVLRSRPWGPGSIPHVSLHLLTSMVIGVIVVIDGHRWPYINLVLRFLLRFLSFQAHIGKTAISRQTMNGF